MAFLNVNNITKSYGDNRVLCGIGFTLEKGQILSIIGSSGSGKTTLLRCLNYLETPDSGNMVLDGDTIMNIPEKVSVKEKRRRQLKLGLVFQSFNLFPHFSVKKNITLAAELKLKEEAKKSRLTVSEKSDKLEEISKRADELLASVGLSDKADSYPSQLSGGQQQRVAIARALMLEPEVLCFDEPTSALDPELTGEVLKVIKSLKSGDRTMIIVTHEMEFARNVSDKVIFMANGVIEEMGTPEEVFDNPNSEILRSFLKRESI